MPESYVYIVTNRSGTLYTGVTSDMKRRFAEHKARATPGFTRLRRKPRALPVDECVVGNPPEL